MRGRNPPPRHVPEPKKAQETDRLNSQVLAQVSLHPEPLLVCSLGQVMQGTDLAQLFICDPQISKNSSDAKWCPSDSESQVMHRGISCEESDVECPCTFGRAGIDWCCSFFALLLSFDCIRSSSLEHMQLVCSCRASMCPSSRLQERCLPGPSTCPSPSRTSPIVSSSRLRRV